MDQKTRVVGRGNKAVPMSIQEFTIFRALQQAKAGTHRTRRMLSRDLVAEVYRGVADPPETAFHSVRATARGLSRKLAHVHLKINCVNRRHHSFYILEELE